MSKSTQMLTERWLKLLNANGYRLTGPRRAVVEVLAASRRALNPSQVFELARRRHPALGLVTVYRTVEKLEALGLVQRVHQPQGCHCYLPASNGHQHLLLCQDCGSAEYFSGDNLETLIKQISSQTGYRILDHWLQLFGTCSNCQQMARA